jgi:hypothetical protein
MKRFSLILLLMFLAISWSHAEAPKPAEAKPVELILEDQFEHRQDIAAHKGNVLILIYGDRKANDDCRKLGEKLHVLFHPTAADQPPNKAKLAPVSALPGVAAGQRSPDAVFIPVAAAGNVPGVIKDFLRSQIKKASPDVPVWLDFSGTMEKNFTLRAGEPNVVVFDATGRLRMKIHGNPDQATTDKLLQSIQNLRAEAAGLAKP